MLPILDAPLLPPRPLRLRRGFVLWSYFGAITLGLAGAAALVAYVAWQLGEARQIQTDHAIWDHGTLAESSNVSGHETSHNFILNSYTLDVDYVDDKGQTHRGKTEFSSLFASVDQKTEADVRYDPAHPERFALRWAIDLRGYRWAAFTFMMVAGIGIGLAFLALAFGLYRRVTDARAVAEDSQEVEIEQTRVVAVTQNGRPTGTSQFHYQLTTEAGKTVKRNVAFRTNKGQSPLYTDAQKSRFLALRSSRSPDRPVILRNDLYPLDLSPEERAEVEKQLARRVTLQAADDGAAAVS
ncbi:MAG TPA: DUF3592 domain-containing protein [Polyangia bacterium]|jgi:hypothetical protein|nr:DUF3592 domain-containing protein [Polyangia bacterium]